jgi:hypothetical protein
VRQVRGELFPRAPRNPLKVAIAISWNSRASSHRFGPVSSRPSLPEMIPCRCRLPGPQGCNGTRVAGGLEFLHRRTQKTAGTPR